MASKRKRPSAIQPAIAAAAPEPAQPAMIYGQMALSLQEQLHLAGSIPGADIVMPVAAVWEGALGVVVIFKDEAQARKAMGSQVKLTPVRWPDPFRHKVSPGGRMPPI